MNERNGKKKLLYSLFGKLPDRNRQVSGQIFSIQECENYLLEHLAVDFNGIESVPVRLEKMHSF